MSRFTFLHAADVHLDSPLHGLRRRAGEGANPFVAATRKALENLVDLALDRRVAFVLLSGDLFDGDWRDFASGQFAVRQLARLSREGIPVVLIRGNHDAENVVTRSLPLPDGVTSLSVRSVQTVVLEKPGVAIHGRGFATRHVEENVALSYPRAKPGLFNVGMLHTSLTGRDGHGVYAPCSVADLQRPGYQYWALGHVHQREVVHEDPHVVYPGNLQGRHAREDGAKGCVLVSVEDGKVAGLDFVPCDAVRFATVDVNLAGAETFEAVFERFAPGARAAVAAAEVRALAARVRLFGTTPLHRRLAMERRALEEGLQAVAWAASDDMLVEKVVDGTAAVDTGGAPALPHFDEVLKEAASDEKLIAGLARTLSELTSALPAEAIALMAREDMPLDQHARLAVAEAAAVVAAGHPEDGRP